MPGNSRDLKKYQRIVDRSKLTGWKCVACLGSGSFGTVLRIRRGGSADCALKVIPIPLTEEEFREREAEFGGNRDLLRQEFREQIRKVFDKEIAVLENCKGHPNIVQLYETDVIPDPDRPLRSCILIRMELLTKLETYLYGKTQKDALCMFRDIARALVFLESRRMLHRDIKRANIMVSSKGVFKLTDFGEARDILGRKAASTRVGTPYYMAPEVALGHPYDARADIYSLAMAVYSCCYRLRYPFQQLGGRSSVTAFEAKEIRLQGRRIPPIPDLDERFNAILLRCLEFEPGARYASARILLDDLENLLRSRSFRNARLELPAPPEEPPTGGSGRPLLIAGIAIGSAALVAIAAFVTASLIKSNRRERVIPTVFPAIYTEAPQPPAVPAIHTEAPPLPATVNTSKAYVRFVDSQGNLLDEGYYAEGEVPVYNGPSSFEDADGIVSLITGWLPAPAPVAAGKQYMYTAVYGRMPAPGAQGSGG